MSLLIILLTQAPVQVSLENGAVLNFDARNLPSDLNSPSPARFTLQAHDGAVSALDVNPHIRGCLVTGGTDKVVKVWNISEDSSQRHVSLVISRDLGIVCSVSLYYAIPLTLVQGQVFSASWSPDDPLTIAAGGSKGKLQVWDVSTNGGVRKAFGSKLQQAGRVLKEKVGNGVVRVASDDEGDSEPEGDE